MTPVFINNIILRTRDARIKRVRRIVSVNRLLISVGECDETEVIFDCRTLYYSGLIRGNGDKLRVFRLDCLIVLLQLHELDNAERSPGASVKEQYNALFAGVIGKRVAFAVSVAEAKIGRFSANTQSVSRRQFIHFRDW